MPLQYQNILQRFGRFLTVTAVSLPAELLLIWVLIEKANLHYTISLGIAFLAILSIRYGLLRKLAFYNTTRGLAPGYIYYLCIAIGGTAVIAGGSYTLVEIFNINPLLARLLLGMVVGLTTFAINLQYNFKVLQK